MTYQPLSQNTQETLLRLQRAAIRLLWSHREKVAVFFTSLAISGLLIAMIFHGTAFLSRGHYNVSSDEGLDEAPLAFLQDDPLSAAPIAENGAPKADLARTAQPAQLGNALGALPERPFEPLRLDPQLRQVKLKVGRGDILMNMLVDAGADRTEAYYAIEAMSEEFSPRKIRAGQELTVTFETPTNKDRSELLNTSYLKSLDVKTDVETTVHVARTGDKAYAAEKVITPLSENYARSGGVIDSSLYLAALHAGIPDAVIVEMISMFSYDIDFQREIRKGDQFEVYYTRLYDPEGNPVKTGSIYFASMTVQGKQKGYYRFETPDDHVTDYYDANGQSAKKFLMRTPINGARISSQFGARKHPVLGYTKMHKGTDFAAVTGTPIMAAGNGTIERASRYGSYGNYVRIRHANGYQTAYAHMSRYGPGIKKGVRVKQGQIIGYVGATGRVTGAHLHYEVMKDGNKVNPLKIKVPTGRKLDGAILASFEKSREKLDTQIAALPDWRTVQTADAEPGTAVSAN